MNKQIDYIQAQLDHFDISLYFTPEHYKAMLNDTLESIVIGGIEFFQGDILFDLDPIAFDESYSGFISCGYDYTQLEEYKQLEDMLIELQEQFYNEVK